MSFVYELLKSIKIDKVRIAFVDVDGEGELLKETFDIERTPNLVYVKDKMVYHMPVGP